MVWILDFLKTSITDPNKKHYAPSCNFLSINVPTKNGIEKANERLNHGIEHFVGYSTGRVSDTEQRLLPISTYFELTNLAATVGGVLGTAYSAIEQDPQLFNISYHTTMISCGGICLSQTIKRLRQEERLAIQAESRTTNYATFQP